jgi:homoserine kinase
MKINIAKDLRYTMLAAIRRREGLSITVTKRTPVSKGLDRSASSAVACVLALEAKDVADAMKESFEDGDISCQRYTTRSSNGARLIDKR